jgi:hypothetical protein
MPLRSDIDTKKLEWLEWYSRSRKKFIAFAVDPGSKRCTGVRRALNGSIVPAYATKARANTPKDETCVQLIRSIEKGALHKGRKEREAARRKK